MKFNNKFLPFSKNWFRRFSIYDTMTNNENKCDYIFNIIDEYETEKPQYPCWSLCNGEEYEQFEIGNEEELKKKN